MELGLIPSSYFHFKQNLDKMAKKDKDLVADVMAGAKEEIVKEEVKKQDISKTNQSELEAAEEKAKLEAEAKEQAELEKAKQSKKKKVSKYLIIAGAVSLSGSRIAKSGEVYPEGAFQSRSIDDLVKNKYIEKVKK